MTASLKSSKKNNLSGEIVIPGDKSISHRAILFGLLSKGKTQIHGSQNSEDVLNSLNVARFLGIKTKVKSSVIFLDSPGIEGLSAPTKDLYFGNSGTGMRLFAGFLSSLNFSSTLTGDASLSNRPMMRIIDPLQKMGAKISATNKENPPLKISPSTGLKGITYKMPIASAQVKSSILLAGLNAEGKTQVQEKYPTRDHTERMMKTFEANISFSKGIVEIEKSIMESNLGLTPNNNGESILIPIPPLSEERRKDLIKYVHQLVEESKVAIRNIRRDALHTLKDFADESHLSEDESRRQESNIQDITNANISSLESIEKIKEKELLEF